MKILKKYEEGGRAEMSQKEKADRAKAKYVMDNNIGYDALDGVSSFKVQEIWGLNNRYGPGYFKANYNESMSSAVRKAGGTEAEVAKAKELEQKRQKYKYWNNEGASSYQQFIPDWYKEGKKNPNIIEKKSPEKVRPTDYEEPTVIKSNSNKQGTETKTEEAPAAEEGAEETLMEKGSKMFEEGGLGKTLERGKLKESVDLKKIEPKKLPTGESARLSPRPEKMEMEKMGEKDDSVTINPTERSRRRPGMSEKQMERLDKKEQEKAMKNREREEDQMSTMSDREKMGHSRRRAREERKMERKQIRHGKKEGRRYKRTMRRKAREERRKARGMEYTSGRRISPRRWYKNLASKLTGGRAGGDDGGLKGYKEFRTSTTDPGYYEDTSGQALRSRRDRTGGKVKSGRGVFTQEEGSVKRYKGTGRDLDKQYESMGEAKEGTMVNKYPGGGTNFIRRPYNDGGTTLVKKSKEEQEKANQEATAMARNYQENKARNQKARDMVKSSQNKYVKGGLPDDKMSNKTKKATKRYMKYDTKMVKRGDEGKYENKPNKLNRNLKKRMKLTKNIAKSFRKK